MSVLAFLLLLLVICIPAVEADRQAGDARIEREGGPRNVLLGE